MSFSLKHTKKTSKADKTKQNQHIKNNRATGNINSPVDNVLNLHQSMGNQAVQRLFESGTIQASLKIGQPNDKYEQEADRVADEVMRMPEPQVQRQTEEEEEEEMIQPKPIDDQITPLVQRQIEPEEEELLQAKSEGQTSQVTSSLESRINALQGGGQPLSKETRNFFEPRFGQDFSGLRVHNDSNAHQLARSINARAFTRGNDVVFGGGEYSPNSSSGKRLLGHELTHVVQQRSTTKVASQAKTIQLSPLSDELSQLWNTQGKGAFYDRLRQVAPVNDPDFVAFVNTLQGDDLWLTQNISTYGRESNWPIHLRVEREMKGWGDSGGKGIVFDILRISNGAKAGNVLLAGSLRRVFSAGSEDLWLGQNLQRYGVENFWPIHLRIEREMKGWADSGGKGAVFDILRAANRTEVRNTVLSTTIRNIFVAGTQDRWLANVLQAQGIEASWLTYLTLLWRDIQLGTMPVPPMEVSGEELVFEDITIPNQTAYNCYEYAMGETHIFRQPGGGVPEGLGVGPRYHASPAPRRPRRSAQR